MTCVVRWCILIVVVGAMLAWILGRCRQHTCHHHMRRAWEMFSPNPTAEEEDTTNTAAAASDKTENINQRKLIRVRSMKK